MFLFIFFSFSYFSYCKLNQPKSVKGVLDLTNWDFEKNGSISIKGEWEFYHNKFLSPNEIHKSDHDIYIDEIGFFGKKIFKKMKINGKKIPKQGYATYRLKIKYHGKNNRLAIKLFDIASSYKLFINGKEVTETGKIGKSFETSIGHYQPKIIHFISNGEIEFVLQVSTFHQFLRFLKNTIIIGNEKQIYHREQIINFEDIFSFGTLFILSFYYLIVHVFYDKTKDNNSSLYFSILCLIMSTRILFSGYRYILTLFPSLSLNFVLTVNYLTYYMGFAVFSLMISAVFPGEFSKKILSLFVKLSVITSIIVLLTPPRVFTYTLPFFQLFTTISFTYILYVLFRAAKNKKVGSKIFLFGMLIYSLFIINDLLYTHGLLDSILLTNYGLFIFIFLNSLVVTKKSIDFIIDTSMKMAFESMEKKRIRGIFEKYVSPEVVTNLVNSDLKSELGGQSKNISILFSDIENFTNLAEKYNPSDIVSYLNSYFDEMINILQSNNGILDKFMGDAVMALFGTPIFRIDHADMAVKTAIEMKNKVKSINEKWKEKIKNNLNIRIGINTGEVVIGNIGSAKRMEYTAIGDNVNLASRLENANKIFGSGIIISESTYKALTHKKNYIIRELDYIKVKGKNVPVKIYEVIDYSKNKKYDNILSQYKEALLLYHQQKFNEALEKFNLIKNDNVSKVYAYRCIKFIKTPPGKNWDKVYEAYHIEDIL